MMLTLIADLRQLDVMVKPGQRIQEIYQRLLKAGFFLPDCSGEQLKVYSMRQKAYVNPMLTFEEGGIYAGDILEFR